MGVSATDKQTQEVRLKASKGFITGQREPDAGGGERRLNHAELMRRHAEDGRYLGLPTYKDVTFMILLRSLCSSCGSETLSRHARGKNWTSTIFW